MSDLPNVLLTEIMSKPSLSDRHGSAALVCKTWCSAATAATKVNGVVTVVTKRWALVVNAAECHVRDAVGPITFA
jgi:hypothetical protein